MNWKPIRKIAAAIYVAIAGNAAVAGVIATGTAGDWRDLGKTLAASFAVIIVGYFVPSPKTT